MKRKILFKACIVLAGLFLLSASFVRAVETVELCHYPPNNPENIQIIEMSVIAEKSLSLHLDHGDCIIKLACDSSDPNCCILEDGECPPFNPCPDFQSCYYDTDQCELDCVDLATTDNCSTPDQSCYDDADQCDINESCVDLATYEICSNPDVESCYSDADHCDTTGGTQQCVSADALVCPEGQVCMDLTSDYCVTQDYVCMDPASCVPGPYCEGTLSAGGRWCDQLDGTVKDMTTGLVWLQDASCMGSMSWYSAIEQPITKLRNEDCSLTDGSTWGDWRLPTLSELEGITLGDEYIRSSQMYKFTGVQSDLYWSSTTDAYLTGNAYGVWMDWIVDFRYKGYDSRVWPVRGDID